MHAQQLLTLEGLGQVEQQNAPHDLAGTMWLGAPLAQLDRATAFKQSVDGSNPSGGVAKRRTCVAPGRWLSRCFNNTPGALSPKGGKRCNHPPIGGCMAEEIQRD